MFLSHHYKYSFFFILEVYTCVEVSKSQFNFADGRIKIHRHNNFWTEITNYIDNIAYYNGHSLSKIN